jgi:hypothetical protein
MSPSELATKRCLEKAAACRRLAEKADSPDLRDSYLRLAMSHERLADSVAQLDDTDHWFAAKLGQIASGAGVDGAR